MAGKKVLKKIGKKKKWFDISLPANLNGGIFSQGFCEAPEDLIGRTINVSLGDAISSPMKKHINLKLKITSVKTSIAQTEVKALEVNSAYLLRKSKKNSKVSAKASGSSSDGFKIDASFCVITYGHCISTAKSIMRKTLKDYLLKTIKESKKDALIVGAINNSIALNVKKSLHKIFPVKSVELEKLKIL
ncbi:MAG: hypothetical protein PHG04_03900 [Candidatus Nanoarchaeia archaeon]|nr:hypothetical protein [Candidatus Nanoarchaeia archaeon]MDD5054488.1 hypothetical protein [Candidatus Nanoarchaeia archaeon]